MQNILRQNNSITVSGKIVSDYTFTHEVYGEKFYTFDLEASRLSNATDTLPVTISERLIDSNLFGKGSFVEISGQIRSYNNFIDKKNHLVLTVFTKNIDPIEDIDGINPNQASLNGYICKPPVYRTTPFGREIADILLAVNRSYNKSDYIPCIAWGRNARFVGNLSVGDNIKITGRMQSRNYQKKLETGEVIEKIAYEISISKLEQVEKEQENNDNQ